MKKSLLIISCSMSKIKRPGLILANELYRPGKTYASIARAKRDGYFPKDNLDVLIISAKYGLLEWNTEIEWYDWKMDEDRANELRPKIQTDLQSYLEGKNYDKLYIKMAKDY